MRIIFTFILIMIANLVFSNTGIYVFNNFQQQTNANIHHNEIKKARNGIFIRNARWTLPWPISFLRVEENTINFGAVPNTTLQFHYGIRLEETDNAYINHNFVDKQNNNNPNANVVPRLRGISLLNSKGNTVTKNEITRLGTGIRAFGSCANSTLACNMLFRNFHGFLFEGPADISYQLPGATPTGNIWTTLPGPASDIEGHISPGIEWYQNGPIIDFSLITGSLLSGAPVYNSNSTICTQFQIQSPIDDRENKFGAIVRNEKNFVSNPSEFILSDKIFTHRYLKENPSYLTLGTSDDSIYQNFMNSCNSNCIGKFNKVHEYIEQSDFTNAWNENTTITDNIIWEYNLKRVNQIYLNYLMNDSIISSDSIELNDIAWSNTLDGGPGVTMARSILNLDIEDMADGNTRSLIEEEETTESIIGISVYPNPSDGLIFIESDSALTNAEVIVTDITGKQVYHNTILTEENVFKINLNLPSGIYHVQIYQTEKKEVFKLIIAD